MNSLYIASSRLTSLQFPRSVWSHFLCKRIIISFIFVAERDIITYNIIVYIENIDIIIYNIDIIRFNKVIICIDTRYYFIVDSKST